MTRVAKGRKMRTTCGTILAAAFVVFATCGASAAFVATDDAAVLPT